MSKHPVRRFLRHRLRWLYPTPRHLRAMRRLGRIEGRQEAERPLPPIFPACPTCLAASQQQPNAKVVPPLAPHRKGVALASWLEQPTRDRLPAMTAQRGGVPPVLKGMRPVQHTTGKLTRRDVLEAVDTTRLNNEPLAPELAARIDTPPEQAAIVPDEDDTIKARAIIALRHSREH